MTIETDQPVAIRPSASAKAAGDGRVCAEGPALHEQIEVMLENQIRPLLKMHGGGVELVSVNDQGGVTLRFQGACRGCSLKSVTYALGIRQRLMQLPGVTRVEMSSVRLSDAALNRVANAYEGYSFWVEEP